MFLFFFWWLIPFFILFMILIGLQLLYYLAWIVVPVLAVALVIWLICKLARPRA